MVWPLCSMWFISPQTEHLNVALTTRGMTLLARTMMPLTMIRRPMWSAPMRRSGVSAGRFLYLTLILSRLSA